MCERLGWCGREARGAGSAPAGTRARRARSRRLLATGWHSWVYFKGSHAPASLLTLSWHSDRGGASPLSAENGPVSVLGRIKAACAQAGPRARPARAGTADSNQGQSRAAEKAQCPRAGCGCPHDSGNIFPSVFKCQVGLRPHLFSSIISFFPLPAPSIPSPKKLPIPQEDYSLLGTVSSQKQPQCECKCYQIGLFTFFINFEAVHVNGLRIQGVILNLILAAVSFKNRL